MIEQQLRQAVESCGQSLYAVAKTSGVSYPILNRWLRGQRGLSLGVAERLANYLGLSLTRTRRTRATKGASHE